MKSFTAGKNEDGARLSRFVENVTSGMPKSLLYKAFRNKRIKVNGKKGAPDTRLCPGDLVELYINDEFFSAAPPTGRPLPHKKRPPLRTVYEDENIAALYKPCSCFVVAGAGYNVVKHGNYGATSVSGASNVMEQHGVKFTNDIDKLRTSMDTCHIAYLHAPLFNPALKAVAPVRKSLGVRSFFNMLGPLVNPIIPTYQLLGVYNLPLLRLYNYTYQESGTRFAVVHSLDGYDEISLTADFKVAMPEKEKLYTPEMLGFKRCTEADLDGGETPEEAARIFDAVLGNRATEAQKSCVIANSAFAIQVICPEKKIETCIAEARESLESGKALATFRKFISLNQR